MMRVEKRAAGPFFFVLLQGFCLITIHFECKVNGQ